MNKIKNIVAIVTASTREIVLGKLKAFDVEERAIAYVAEWFEPLVTW
jgi:hypothetical protein